MTDAVWGLRRADPTSRLIPKIGLTRTSPILKSDKLMEKTLEKPTLPSEPTLMIPAVPAATDGEILTYLRYCHKIAHIAGLAERDALILAVCDQLKITVTDAEWQAAGDAFRLEHRLSGAHETFTWLTDQRISAEAWSEGIKIELLTQKLKTHLFGDVVDHHYLSNRDHYKRVALSQILSTDLSEALKIVRLLREEQVSFCALALEHSKGKQSRESGGFMGIHFLSELMPEIVQAIAEAPENTIVGPIQTRFGHHVIKVEKWFPVEFNQTVRETVLGLFFETWLQEVGSRDLGT
jgi:PPIC-type PPIASE domain